ncbi:MAG: 5'-nucleotidase C-terminal domain-containing protein [Proteobacteria bacterium]|nr:5'-nucleotidase C-terminal domain-containing protein [Pseudomonadota bacterium]MBU1650004.1 5'-nucleotidase C-terminal domain-containing protein [Pseudomonadota bacterium]MBU1986083.1 5'-nucleotidase C-terminal domain-containing protein [Pseudomonadota bacterium]
MKVIALGLLLLLNISVPSWAAPTIPGSHGISPSLAVAVPASPGSDGISPSLVVAVPTTFRIYYINDFHGFANPTQLSGGKGQQGGIAWLASRLKRLRTEQPGLFLAAGDMIQGDTWTNFSQGYSTIALLNQLHLDAMVTGNHEYDFGQDVLKKRISEASFPVLAANVQGLPGVHPHASFNLPAGKVTVIGLVTDDVPQSSHPRNTQGLSFSPPLQVAREQLTAMKKNTGLFVLLTHIGYEQDLALAKNLCQGPDALDVPILIVGGHSHTEVKTPVRIGNCAVVVQAGDHGRFLGVVDMTVEQGQLVAVEGRLDEIVPAPGGDDPEIAALVKRYNAQVDIILNQKGGETNVDLIQKGVRQQETNLGNLVADIVRSTTGAQAALVNGGSLRTGLNKGEITFRQIYAALPFNSYLVAVKMSGNLLLETLEHGVSGVERGEGRFPQVSGMTFVFDRRLPVGQRIVSATVGGHPIDPQQEYSVATLDFIAAGGDGYTAFGQAIRSGGDFVEIGGAMRSSRLVYNDPGGFLRDVVLDVLAKDSPVAPVVEGRIVEEK